MVFEQNREVDRVTRPGGIGRLVEVASEFIRDPLEWNRRIGMIDEMLKGAPLHASDALFDHAIEAGNRGLERLGFDERLSPELRWKLEVLNDQVTQLQAAIQICRFVLEDGLGNRAPLECEVQYNGKNGEPSSLVLDYDSASRSGLLHHRNPLTKFSATTVRDISLSVPVLLSVELSDWVRNYQQHINLVVDILKRRSITFTNGQPLLFPEELLPENNPHLLAISLDRPNASVSGSTVFNCSRPTGTAIADLIVSEEFGYDSSNRILKEEPGSEFLLEVVHALEAVSLKRFHPDLWPNKLLVHFLSVLRATEFLVENKLEVRRTDTLRSYLDVFFSSSDGADSFLESHLSRELHSGVYWLDTHKNPAASGIREVLSELGWLAAGK